MCCAQGMLVHPGWNAIVPCQATMQEVYVALECGNLDLPIRLKTSQGKTITSLREVMAIPTHQQAPMLVEANARIVNANYFKQADGDEYHRTMLRTVGVFQWGPLCATLDVFCLPALWAWCLYIRRAGPKQATVHCDLSRTTLPMHAHL